MQCLHLRGLFAGAFPALFETFISFSHRWNSSSCLFIGRSFLHSSLCSRFLQPSIQFLIAGGTHTGSSSGITAAFTFLFLFSLHCFRQVIAVMGAKHTASLTVLPEEAFAAGFRPVSIVADPVNQNHVLPLFVSHFNILLSFDTSPKKSGNDKSPSSKSTT